MRAFVSKVIRRGQPWIDSDFPPEPESLFNPNIDRNDQSKFDSLDWKRATECYEDPKIFCDGIHPNDIN